MVNEVFTGSKVYLKDDFFELHKSLFSNYIYDQNFMLLKKVPLVTEFLRIENTLKKYCVNNFLLFKLNLDLIPGDKLLNYVQSKNYSVNKLLLYSVTKTKFKNFDIKKIDITISFSSKDNHIKFLDLKWTQDLDYGKEFALQNRAFILKMLESNSLDYFLAERDNQIIGLISTIEHDNSIEIYDLYVLPSFREQNIATALQKKL